MFSDIAIRVIRLSKVFPIYAKPHHRLFQMIVPGLRAGASQEFHALRGIDFEVRRGETVGIVGRNGSGKSTLLQIICGTLSPSDGDIVVNGRIAALLELGAGFNPEFTGRENVILNATVLGLTRDEIDARFDEIAGFADIGDFMDQPVKSYSSGMYVRLAFAVAIHVEPDILIVDEALSVGDEAFQRKCFARIEAIRSRGATILFVSHSATAVVDLCDRALLIDKGQLLISGEPKMVVSLYQRMLHAPAEAIPGIRQEIVASGAKQHDGGNGIGANEAMSRLDKETEFSEGWDEGLANTSEIAYENRGATISNVRMETADGRSVNILLFGRRYFYKYDVIFHRGFRGVRFGMMIKTVTGAELGGTATAHSCDEMISVQEGERIAVSFDFKCMLSRGVYFMNAGVLAQFEHGEEFADRRIDVIAFRVQPSNRMVTGFVDFDFSSRFEVST